MSRAQEPLLPTVPCGTVLSGLLHILLSPDQRDEFTGDLVEEARLRLRFCSRSQLAAWIWLQMLRSVPALLVLRMRRLGARPLSPVGGPFSLVGGRMGQRGLPLSLAISLSLHALIVVAVASWAFFRDDEVEEPPRQVLDFLPAFLAEPPQEASLPGAVPAEQPQARRAKAPRRATRATVAAPTLPAVESPVADPVDPPAITVDRVTVEEAPREEVGRRVRVPLEVAEKRCVSCPPPQLPPAYARLGMDQQMVVKTCVGVNGEVTSVDVLRGFDSKVSERVTETVRGWRLTPYSLDGHPVPFCYPTRFIFASR
jgi:hypothetical protein